MLTDDVLYKTLEDGTKTVSYDGPPLTAMDTIKILEVSRRRMIRNVEELQRRIRLNEETQKILEKKS